MPPPRMTPVRSSAVARVGYDALARELHVAYVREHPWAVERTYVYSDVPARIHRELLAADSVGAFVNREVKPRFHAREL
ncbi:KTSC domain-containing protein [Conexibacter sp. CPCC 206217]|uniref:KTSC domain-containing protein n=1 Tax=Conexibacter sp. CPCC 206217 TaxID=3064574 RepID=UPI002726A818|nr:KTSC domain-containing protein [Conexibacter sp. CPCC 206217]MDO8212840.1 KTSC domain-containing protein [Conexibacter sp. CPCC 206217]